MISLITGLLLIGCEGPEIDLDETPMDVLSETTGYGSVAENGMLVTVDYHVFFPGSGETLLRDSAFSFILGQGAVIRGIDEAVAGMREGGVKVISCPPQRHWGRAGYADGTVPPDTTLNMRLVLKRAETTDDNPELQPRVRSSETRRFSSAPDRR